LRLTPPELLSPKKAECCEALWEDKSHDSLVFWFGSDSFGPIRRPGRTFASNSTVGANAVYAYSDNDGDSWIPFGIAAPNGGAITKHRHRPVSGLVAHAGNSSESGQAVYYCSQDIVGPATCYRSDDLGISYGPSVLAYTGQARARQMGDAEDYMAIFTLHQTERFGCQYPTAATHKAEYSALDAGITWHEFNLCRILPPKGRAPIHRSPSTRTAESIFPTSTTNRLPKGNRRKVMPRVQVGSPGCGE